MFKLTPSGNGSWTEDILYHFAGGSDGQQPNDIVFWSRRRDLQHDLPGWIGSLLHGMRNHFPIDSGLWWRFLDEADALRLYGERGAAALLQELATKPVAARCGS